MTKSEPRIRKFTVPKAGNLPEENEDKFCAHDRRRGGEVARLALSDGATEAAFSDKWADALVKSDWHLFLKRYTGSESEEGQRKSLESWIETAQAQFAENVAGLTLPWYAKLKMDREGAFATFLGVRLTQGRGRRRWSAIACGDSCVFRVSHGAMRESFPLKRASEFGNRPNLLPSHSDRDVPDLRCHQNNMWERGDTFVLASDALALWLLSEESNTRMAMLLGCSTEDDFGQLIDSQRSSNKLKNDDTTALIFKP